MKDMNEGRQLNFDFSNQVAEFSERRSSVLQLVHKANPGTAVTRNLINLNMRARVLENLLKTRITES